MYFRSDRRACVCMCVCVRERSVKVDRIFVRGFFLRQDRQRHRQIGLPVAIVSVRLCVHASSESSGKCVPEKNLTNPAKCGCKSVDSDRSAEMSAASSPRWLCLDFAGSHRSV